MHIGDNIKKLRRERDITQEKFAEYLNVSPQAVSRWENGVTYPDIMTIPAIATFFGVSTDLLLGVEEDRREAKIQEYLTEYNKLRNSGNKARRLALIKEAKKLFPGDFRILISYAWELAASPYTPLDGICTMTPEELTRCRQEIISVCQNIVEDCPIDEIRYDAIHLLSTTYSETGDMENAVKTAKRLPDYEYTQNMTLYCLYGYDTEEHIAFHQESIRTLISHLWLWIRSAAAGQQQPENKIALYQKAVALFELMFENSDFGYEHTSLAQLYENLTAVYLETGNTDAALDALEQSVRHSIAFIQTPDRFAHTSLLFDRLTFKREALSKDYTCSHADKVLHFLEQSIYDPIRTTERFRALQQQLRAIR